MSGAARRVAASRAAIRRQWLADASASREPGGIPAAGPWGAVAGWALDLVGQHREGGISPWRAGLQLACSLAEEGVAPLARRHPWALVGGAAVGGVLLVSARPWRWLARPPMLSRLFTQAALAAVAQGIGGRGHRRYEERGAAR